MPAMNLPTASFENQQLPAEHGLQPAAVVSFEDAYDALARRSSRLFAVLLTFEWAAAIAIAIYMSPLSYVGSKTHIHVHVYAAVFLGAAFTALPLVLIRRQPAAPITRHVVAACQMLMNGLLIDLTGGRIETHFLIFGTLAFIAFYRDWRVLVTASLVTAADHWWRGVFMPQSIYGVLLPGSLRWMEHTIYVLFEDVFLIIMCVYNVRDMHAASIREAELGRVDAELRAARDSLELRVKERTAALDDAVSQLQAEVLERSRSEESLRRTETLLSAATAEAQAASEAKSAFLANMSHEIRTPITAIIGFSDLMLGGQQSSSDQHDCVQTIRRNSKHLLELINDILDISKIEAGKLTAEQRACELPQLLCDVFSMIRTRALEKDLDLSLHFATPIPRRIRTDPLRLRQILVNLLGNAVKFTERGRVELRLAAESTGSDWTIRFSVVDSGMGFNDEQAKRLFQPFMQADGSTTRRFGGTGLGLTISRRLAILLGGDVTACSTAGVGSIFTATINGGQREPEPEMCESEDSILSLVETEHPATSFKLSGRVLLAEDGIDNQRFISAMLRLGGAEVHVVANGRAAVQQATSQSFDLIFMDMQMPEMDGYEATMTLRRRGYTKPIVALTAHAMADDRAKCLNAGCTDYLTKPIDRMKLLRAASHHLGGTPTLNDLPKPAEATAPMGTSSPDASRVLLSTCAGEPEMAGILVEFVEALPGEITRLQALIADRDREAIRDACHQLKGAGGSYGFQSLSIAAARAERKLAKAPQVEDVAAELSSLIELIRSIEGYDVTREEVACKRS